MRFLHPLCRDYSHNRSSHKYSPFLEGAGAILHLLSAIMGLWKENGQMIYTSVMIYLINSTSKQDVHIRKPVGGSRDNNLHFILFSNGEARKVVDTDVTAISSWSYYRFKVQLPEGCASGEYRYELRSRGELMSCGIAQIGTYTNASTERASNGIQFKQYGE